MKWIERHQVTLYLAGLALGGIAGVTMPAVARPAETAIHPLLALVLYATFLGIPFGRVGRALRDWRFLSTILVVNFVFVPVIAWLLSRLVAHDEALLVGVLFVLLTPCIDYVIVFAGLAGGDGERLLIAAPLLLLAQVLLLPLYLWLFVGAEFVESIDIAPFAETFVFIIALPFLAAALTRFGASRTRAGGRLLRAAMGAVVPLMVVTLAVVVASQIAGVSAKLSSLLLLLVPIYVLFAAAMVPVGMSAARIARLDAPGGRSVVFSGATRNSIVVLPLVIALPADFDLAPLVVVTQTLVELVVMMIFVRLIPRLVPASPSENYVHLRSA